MAGFTGADELLGEDIVASGVLLRTTGLVCFALARLGMAGGTEVAFVRLSSHLLLLAVGSRVLSTEEPLVN